MNTLFELLERKRPPVAAVLTGPITEAPSTEVIEVRADIFTDLQNPKLLKKCLAGAAFTDKRVLFTLRESAESGMWVGSEGRKLLLLSRAMPFVDGVDVELQKGSLVEDVRAIVDEDERSSETVVIGSYHDLEGTPSPLLMNDLYYAGLDRGADYVKFATTVNTKDDLDTLVEFTEKVGQDGGLITVGMGELGPESRRSLPLVGSRMCYAPIGEAVVPGQISIDALNQHLDNFYR